MAGARRLLVAVVACVGLVGCSGSDDESSVSAAATESPIASAAESTPTQQQEAPEPDPADFHHGPIPDEARDLEASALPPEPGEDAPLADRFSWKALEAVSEFARVVDPEAVATCPDIDPREDSEATCVVTYDGREWQYRLTDLTWEGSGISSETVEYGNVSYRTELAAGPLHQEVVEDALRLRFTTEYTICDMEPVEAVDLVDVETVDVHGDPYAATGVQCRLLLPTGDLHMTQVFVSERGGLNFENP